MTEDEMVGWHHQLNEHEFGQTPEDTEGQGSLACCPSYHTIQNGLSASQSQSTTLFPHSMYHHLNYIHISVFTFSLSGEGGKFHEGRNHI